MITLAEAKEALNLEATVTDNDTEIQAFIDASTIVVEDVIGPANGVQSFTEQHHPNGSRLVLNQARPVTFTLVVEYDSGSPTTLTKAATPDVATASQFTVNKSILTRRAAGGAETDFADEVWVTYTAGFASPPANVKLAMRELVQSSYQQSQQGQRPEFGSIEGGQDGYVATPSGYLVSYRVMSWLEPYADLRIGIV